MFSSTPQSSSFAGDQVTTDPLNKHGLLVCCPAQDCLSDRESMSVCFCLLAVFLAVLRLYKPTAVEGLVGVVLYLLQVGLHLITNDYPDHAMVYRRRLA